MAEQRRRPGSRLLALPRPSTGRREEIARAVAQEAEAREQYNLHMAAAMEVCTHALCVSTSEMQ